jgi:hypothetical protein
MFKVVKSKKRKPKQEPAIGSLNKVLNGNGLSKLFDVKKYAVPSGASSNKGLPTIGSDTSSEDPALNEINSQLEKKSNESMRSRSQDDEKGKI